MQGPASIRIGFYYITIPVQGKIRLIILRYRRCLKIINLEVGELVYFAAYLPADSHSCFYPPARLGNTLNFLIFHI